MLDLLNPEHIITGLGLLGVALALYAETGLLIGFFLPGDTLLFAAGIFAATGYFPLWALFIIASIAAVLGDITGYVLGKKWGPKIFTREESFFFRKKNVYLAQQFYEKHGGKTIFFARFIPFIRTFAPVVAGVAEMPYNKFAVYNISGGIVWVISLSLVGFYLGKKVEHIDQYVLPFLGIIIVLSFFAPLFLPLLKKIFRKK